MTRKNLLAITVILLAGLGFAQENNDFYDNTPVRKLAGTLKIEVAGETANPGPVDLAKLPRHSLITRETRVQNGALQFIGSYRYDGYSLFDIIKEKYVAKRNQNEFKPVVDMLVMVENGAGEKAVFSWGEIYYPTVLHRIIVADRVAPIIPSETKDEWPLPDRIKLVCGNDMVTERNLSDPVKITLFAAPQSFPTVKGMKPLHSPSFSFSEEGQAKEIVSFPQERRTYPTVFYGRGKGFHGIQYFSGILLRDVLRDLIPLDAETIRRGYLIVAAADGYRIAVTCSELVNRNDQDDFLLIDRGKGQDGGRFTLYPAGDFFSDRAVKALKTIILKRI